MPVPTDLYRPSLALLTDFYELTMAAAAWKSGIAGEEAVFTLSFRKNPFEGGFTLAAGLESVIDHVSRHRFDASDLAYLAEQRDGHGKPLFEPGFLEYLGRLELAVDVDAVPEGTAVFPWEPVLRVRGPVIPCMLLETPLLTLVNFQTLIATKAARVCLAAGGAPVLEFGARRAQGFDGALSASRAAYLGGCAGTSNVLAGKLFGIPVKGTHAHAWVMLFDDEREAFRAYAGAMPGNCVLLVDTYDSLAGVERAIETGRWLREHGGELAGIRLDSGDLAWLSQEARRRLDAAGFERTAIMASNELDEHIIVSLRDQGACIAAWGVGTRLVTGADDGALGGVYKLGAVRRGGGPWQHRVKLSEQSSKTSVPGVLQVRRFRHDGVYLADCIYDELTGLPAAPTIVDPTDHTRRREIPAGTPGEDLLAPIFRGGRLVYAPPALEEARRHAARELAALHAGVKRFVYPHQFPAGLERNLFDLRTRLVLEARGLPAA
ncbi:nicotinate phosphoribosyltransferase [Anaeromyxobacter diazotrophicus]|uniref:Nicotinate phosphoribosyltransferase n=1 Tax=Anaeromyxobacter diazotrophicus TaxID=2590199 RepID=A0A7I9VL95_9BACT|nr:nicotinate phosphoribosyltransferase [Anaeromyxobacter diazotrophicus]GEJ56879.1 nicotinate phosphoribosyltransferase [Anaeromyxobacter diazotrophicus]